ncbi:hypothetical protein [Geodermatophilus maliterrae]|uniref:Antibiotic biosynthesis monooxygenase n=1 Tax=Geodermatophilus maliterrae TaxID=3162531 RepID=A0ABV3XN05_9ACTN
MPSTPWTPVAAAVDPSAVLTLVGVHLRLRAGSDLDALTAWADRLGRELTRTPDLVGHARRWSGGAFWVVSAWTRRASLVAFERGPLHTAAQRELRALLHPPVVDVWRADPADLPPTWEEVGDRLRAAGERTRTRLASR